MSHYGLMSKTEKKVGQREEVVEQRRSVVRIWPRRKGIRKRMGLHRIESLSSFGKGENIGKKEKDWVHVHVESTKRQQAPREEEEEHGGLGCAFSCLVLVHARKNDSETETNEKKT